MGRGVLRPLGVRGPAKPLNWGRAGEEEAVIRGHLAVELPVSAGRGTADRGDARVMQRTHKGRGRRERGGRGYCGRGRVAFRHSPPLPSFLRRQESIRRASATTGRKPRLPSSPGSTSFPRKREPTGGRHSRVGGNPAPLRRASAAFPLSLQGERTPRTRRERVLRSGRKPRHSLPLPSFLRRQESIRRASAPSWRKPRLPSSPGPHVIPAKAGTYWRPPFPPTRESRPHRTARKRRVPPLPIETFA